MQFAIGVVKDDALKEECEALIESYFGKVMRMGVEPLEVEMRSPSITTLYAKDMESGRVVSTARCVDASYLLKSELLTKEYHLSSLPKGLLSRTIIAYNLCIVTSSCRPSFEGGYNIPILLSTFDSLYLKERVPPFYSILKEMNGEEKERSSVERINRFLKELSEFNIDIFNEEHNIHTKRAKDAYGPLIQALFRYSVLIKCSEGDLVVKEGRKDESIGFILQGSLDVYKKKRKISTLHRGDIFGEIGFILKEKRTASLVASSKETIINYITLNSIDSIANVEDKMIFWRSLCTVLAKRLMITTDIIGE